MQSVGLLWIGIGMNNLISQSIFRIFKGKMVQLLSWTLTVQSMFQSDRN